MGQRNLPYLDPPGCIRERLVNDECPRAKIAKRFLSRRRIRTGTGVRGFQGPFEPQKTSPECNAVRNSVTGRT